MIKQPFIKFIKQKSVKTIFQLGFYQIPAHTISTWSVSIHQAKIKAAALGRNCDPMIFFLLFFFTSDNTYQNNKKCIYKTIQETTETHFLQTHKLNAYTIDRACFGHGQVARSRSKEFEINSNLSALIIKHVQTATNSSKYIKICI